MNRPDSWLRGFISLTEDTEIPDSFALWCGISTIASALGRHIYLDMGVYKVFPNMFILLVAGSGKCRKSTAIGVAECMIYSMEPQPRIISQKITPEALIESLKVDQVVEGEPLPSEGIVIVDELSTFLNKKSYEAGIASLLIPFWDCKEVFEYRTKARGVERIEKACLNLLSGSTIDWIKSALPEDAIGGGLTSRIIFVYEDQPRDPRAWTQWTKRNEETQVVLTRWLQEISAVSGEMKLSDEAKELWETEYNRFYEESTLYDNPFLSGYASRRGVHLLKTAMVFSMAETLDLVVEAKHLEGAKLALELIEHKLPEVMHQIASNEVGAQASKVLGIITRRGRMTRTELLRAVSHHLTHRDLDLVMETLIKSRQVEIAVEGNSIVYSILRG